MKKVTINKMKIALVLNYVIVVLVVVASIIMFTSYKLTFLKEPVLEERGFNVFKFFTVDSNILLGIGALLLANKERKLLTGKIKDIPVGFYILKFMGTVSVTLTFAVVFFYLGRINKFGLIGLLQNSNLFFHMAIPILSIITFVLFERTNKIKFSYAISGLIPMLLYGIYYVINVLVHMENGKVSAKIDWYWFMQGGIGNVYKTSLLLIGVTFIISMILWLSNKRGE